MFPHPAPCPRDERPVTYYICSMLAKYVNTYDHIYHYNMNIYHDRIVFIINLISRHFQFRSCMKTTGTMQLPLQFYFIYVELLQMYCHFFAKIKYLTIYLLNKSFMCRSCIFFAGKPNEGKQLR